MYDDYDYEDYADDDSDLRNFCAVCGHDFREDGHDNGACAESQE